MDLKNIRLFWMDNNLIQKTIIDRISKTMSVKSDNQIM